MIFQPNASLNTHNRRAWMGYTSLAVFDHKTARDLLEQSISHANQYRVDAARPGP